MVCDVVDPFSFFVCVCVCVFVFLFLLVRKVCHVGWLPLLCVTNFESEKKSVGDDNGGGGLV